ncbi:MAG: ATP-binding cassette domain-containing protein, partial [Rhodoglobus sp.]
MTPAATATSETVLEVTDLGVDFWVDGTFYPAAIGLTYTVKRGEVLAIVGESGSGKSSSSMALLGLLPANSKVTGSVKLLGRELRGIPQRELMQVRGNQIAVIFQEPMTALNPVYTIGFQIMEALRSHFDLNPAQAKERAIDLLTKVEMPDPKTAFHKYPHQLSGGQRQRAMIAQSISCDPVLLIADEPTTALDVTVQAEILDLLRSLHKRLDSAILLITHDMGVVADLADNILVMKDGVGVESGTVIDVFTKPKHPYTQSLLAAVPSLGTADMTISERELAKKDHRPPVLQFEDVAIDYPKRGRVPAFRAAEHINLAIHPGEIVGLVGESGCGKSTTGRAVIQLYKPSAGSVIFDGTALENLEEYQIARAGVGRKFQ